MNPIAVGSEEWEECPKGTLQSLAKRSRRQRTMKREAWATPLLLVTLFAWAGWLPTPFSPQSTALACDQVVKLLPDYATNSLSAIPRAQVEQHLKKCPFCSEKLRAIRAIQPVVENSVVRRVVPRSNNSVDYAQRITNPAIRESLIGIAFCLCPS